MGNDPLTPRERMIVTLVSEGLSSKAIASRFRVAGGTIEMHLRKIYEKLQNPPDPDDTPPANAAAALLRPTPFQFIDAPGHIPLRRVTDRPRETLP